VPTPFTHLRFALELLTAADLPPALSETLRAEQPAFLLGSIAPDVQTVSGQTREATHFFHIPRRDALSAHQHLFEQHPGLAQPRQLPAPQAAAISGYLTHILLDEIWVEAVFEPVFGYHQPWGTLPERLYLHNALRSYVDERDRRYLSNATGASLHAARPKHWLPFVGDDSLLRWRDLVAEQLTPGHAARTVEVFAQRMGADPRALAALLASPEEMHRRVFARLPAGKIDSYYAEGLARGARLLQTYWG
jgi:hypothetical protein